MTGNADSLRRTATALVTALDEGDLRGATDAAVALSQAEVEPATTVEAYRSTVENGEDGAARVLLSELRQTYEARAAAESRAVERSLLARGTDIPTSEKQALSAHVERAAAASFARGQLLTESGSFFASEAPDDRRDALVDTADTVVAAERTFAERQARARTLTRARELPASVAVLDTTVQPDPLVSGEQGTLSVTVANVGDGPASEVRLFTDGFVEFRPDDRIIGSLAAGTEETVTLGVRSRRTGQVEAELRVVSASGEVTEPVDLTVVANTPPLRAIDRDQDGQVGTAEVQRAVALWHAEEPVPGTGGLTLGTEDITRLLQVWANDLPTGTGGSR